MSEHRTFPKNQGLGIANTIRGSLYPYIDKFTTVGSLGRGEDVIGDIDLLVQPKSLEDIPWIKAVIERAGVWVKGGDRQMTIKEVFHTRGLRLDLFLCHPPAQWGVLKAFRLLKADQVIELKRLLGAYGYRHKGGTIYDDYGELILPDVKDVLKLVGSNIII